MDSPRSVRPTGALTVERAFLFIGGLCWVLLTLLLITWDNKPRRQPIEE